MHHNNTNSPGRDIISPPKSSGIRSQGKPEEQNSEANSVLKDIDRLIEANNTCDKSGDLNTKEGQNNESG